MIVLDANILLYAYDSRTPLHQQVKSWLERSFSSGGLIGLPWQTIGAFLRIATNTKLPGDRYSSAEACPPSADRQILEVLARNHYQRPSPKGTDNRCLSGGANHKLWGHPATTDRDFVRFPGLRWLNPIAP